MVTTIRAITQELDGFGSEYLTQIEHKYVDNRALSEEIADALKGGAKNPAYTEAVAA